MDYHKLAPLRLLGFKLFKETVPNVKFSNLHDVLNMVVDLDETEVKLKYSSVHLVPCFTKLNPSRVALVQNDRKPNEPDLNFFIINFINLEDINWEEVVNDDWIFWTENT